MKLRKYCLLGVRASQGFLTVEESKNLYTNFKWFVQHVERVLTKLEIGEA